MSLFALDQIQSNINNKIFNISTHSIYNISPAHMNIYQQRLLTDLHVNMGKKIHQKFPQSVQYFFFKDLFQ